MQPAAAIQMVLSSSEPEQAASVLARAKRGDRDAFEQLLRLHERQVLGVCLRMLGEGGEAEEAAQDVFMKLYRGLGGLREGSEVGPWLYRVAANACRDRLRARRNFDALEDSVIPPVQPGFEMASDDARQWARVQLALNRLPPQERMALVLRDIEGVPTRQVALILGNREDTVRSQIASARTKLRKWLGVAG